MQQSFLTGKSILLTGVTGFVGKAVLESILRDHHRHIKHVYCLVRASDRQSIHERMKQVLDAKLFDGLRSRVGVATFKAIAAKIVPIQGDISKPGVGISDLDLKLLHAHLNLVIHSAATVNFNMPLKDALRINTLGTMELLAICERGAQFQGFVYISTAYVNANIKSGKVEEKLYPMPLGDPATLVDEIQNMSQEQAIRFTDKVLQEYPNTYTFTKSIAEHLLYSCTTPTASVRLSVVASAALDPVPGWVDGTSGLNGASILIGQGIIDTLHIPKLKSPDIVPVDFATNAITRICAELLDAPSNQIYHVGSSAINPMMWKVFFMASLKVWRQLPPIRGQLFPPDCHVIESPADYRVRLASVEEFKFHTLPTLIDPKNTQLISQIKRAKQKLALFHSHYDYFLKKRWTFDISNLAALESTQSARTDILSSTVNIAHLQALDWDQYITQFIHGLHHFVLKETSLHHQALQEIVKTKL